MKEFSVKYGILLKYLYSYQLFYMPFLVYQKIQNYIAICNSLFYMPILENHILLDCKSTSKIDPSHIVRFCCKSRWTGIHDHRHKLWVHNLLHYLKISKDDFFCFEILYTYMVSGNSDWQLISPPRLVHGIWNGCSSTKTVHIWLYIGEVKMCLMRSSSFLFSKICLQFFKLTTAARPWITFWPFQNALFLGNSHLKSQSFKQPCRNLFICNIPKLEVHRHIPTVKTIVATKNNKFVAIFNNCILKSHIVIWVPLHTLLFVRTYRVSKIKNVRKKLE